MTTLRKRTRSEREIETKTIVCEDYSDHFSVNMAYRNRTSEFLSVCKSKENFRNNGYISKTKNFKNNNIEVLSNFMETAKQIGRDIANTYVKLEKLTLLAKRKPLYDEELEIEMNQLTYIIKQDLQNLNQQIAHLQMTKSGNSALIGKRQSQAYIGSVVLYLQEKLSGMGSDFKGLLKKRTENLKHQKSRREKFINPREPVKSDSFPLLLSNKTSTEDVAINMGDYSPTLSPNNMLQRQNQLQLLDQQDSYLESRADAMENIESTIVELGTIFNQLANMVKEQEETIQRIDASVENSFLNVEAAHSEILRYFNSVTSNRYLIIKIFAILILFFIIFVVFLA